MFKHENKYTDKEREGSMSKGEEPRSLAKVFKM